MISDDQRKATVERLQQWLVLLSDHDRFASVEECCLAEMYLKRLYSDAPKTLQRDSRFRVCLNRQRTVWIQDRELAAKERQAAKFAAKVLAAEWARRALLAAWMPIAKTLEANGEDFGYKCGNPTWATAEDYAAVEMEGRG